MIMQISVPASDTDEGSKEKIVRISGVTLDKFPIIFIGRDSYLVSGQDEAGLNLNPDFVYNLHIGNFCALAHELKFVIDINHNYKSVSTGRLRLPPQPQETQVTTCTLPRKGQILIQNDVWVGRGATIMGGVTIHNGAVGRSAI